MVPFLCLSLEPSVLLCGSSSTTRQAGLCKSVRSPFRLNVQKERHLRDQQPHRPDGANASGEAQSESLWTEELLFFVLTIMVPCADHGFLPSRRMSSSFRCSSVWNGPWHATGLGEALVVVWTVRRVGRVCESSPRERADGWFDRPAHGHTEQCSLQALKSSRWQVLGSAFAEVWDMCLSPLAALTVR